MFVTLLFILFSAVVLIFITRPITTIFHELGHAIPILFFTKKDITIYIGSYGDTSKSFNFNIGRLKIWVKYTNLIWGGGLCSPEEKKISYNKIFIYTLAGPITSLLIALLASLFIFNPSLHGSMRLFLVILMASSVFDLFVNLIPNPNPIKLDNGNITYNDGQSIKNYFIYLKQPKNIRNGAILLEEEKFEEALLLFKKEFESNKKSIITLKYLIFTLNSLKQYDKSKEYIEIQLLNNEVDENDYITIGYVYSNLKEMDKAIQYTDKAIQLNPYNYVAINNKAYWLYKNGQYNEALILINQSIEIEENYPFSLCTKSSILLKIGNLEDSFELSMKVLEIDPIHNYAYINLAEYYLLNNNKEKALEMLHKAKELEKDIEEYNELYQRAIKL